MGTFIVGVIVVLCVLLAVRSIVQNKKSGSPQCGGDCSRCKGHCN